MKVSRSPFFLPIFIGLGLILVACSDRRSNEAEPRTSAAESQTGSNAPLPDPHIQAALEELRKLVSYIEAGLSKLQYDDRFLTVNAAIDVALDKATDKEAAELVRFAIDKFAMARTWWTNYPKDQEQIQKIWEGGKEAFLLAKSFSELPAEGRRQIAEAARAEDKKKQEIIEKFAKEEQRRRDASLREQTANLEVSAAKKKREAQEQLEVNRRAEQERQEAERRAERKAEEQRRLDAKLQEIAALAEKKKEDSDKRCREALQRIQEMEQRLNQTAGLPHTPQEKAPATIPIRYNIGQRVKAIRQIKLDYTDPIIPVGAQLTVLDDYRDGVLSIRYTEQSDRKSYVLRIKREDVAPESRP